MTRKVVAITHAYGTINLHPSGGGEDRDTVDARVNAKLAEGYDDVEVIPLSFPRDVATGQVTAVVNQYIFRKYEEEVVTVATDEASAPKRGRKVKEETA